MNTNTITDSLPTTATKAILPSPTIGAALDGGLGYYDLFDRTAYTQVQVGPLPAATIGDTVTVFWAGAAVARHQITISDLTLGVFPIAVQNAAIADAGDGDKVVNYTLTYTQGGGEDHSEPVLIKVKQSIPGGLDPHPGTPHVNENLPAASVAPDPVPGDATQVVVVAPLWINPALGDVMIVSWNGANFFASALTEPFPDAVSVTLTAEQVLDAGVGPAVPVTWGVHDVVANWSAWAPETVVDVRLENPGLFLAPRVGDKDVPWTQIDLVTLGDADLVVFTPSYDGAVAADQVIVHTRGIAFDGETYTYDTPAQSTSEPTYGMTFTIPNAVAIALGGGTLRVWYTVKGRPVPESHSVWLPVLGQATGDLPVPEITEAEDSNGDGSDDQLDPDKANPAHVTINYPGMLAFDTVTLIWDGRSGDGTPVHYEVDRQVSSVAPLKVSVAQTEILKFLDGNADVYYRVVPFSARGRAFARALAARESVRLPLRIRRIGAEQPLPAPTVLEVVDGFLDPAAEEATLQAPLYPGIAKGDEITYAWVGTVSTQTRIYKVADAAKPPADYADRDFITQNTGAAVIVSYSVKRLGANPAVPSETVEFRIGLAEPFAIDTTTMTLAPGSSQARTATGGTTPYRYDSADAAVATVNASTGAVAAKAQGQTTITASDAANQSASYNVTVTAAFAIDPSTVTLAPGGTATRTATGGTTPYRYGSTNAAVATVNASTGAVAAKAQGQTTITASDAANQSASYNVTVTAAFAIDPSTVTLAPGGTATRTATGGTTPYSYVSANAAVASVNASTGVVTAKAQGQTTITASDAANQSASYNVTVTAAFAIDTSTVTLAPGGTATRTATGGTTPYSYVSANAAVATVNASTGAVAAKAQGQTTITATDAANQSASYNVTVTSAFAIDTSIMTLAPGGTSTRTATGGTTPYSYVSANAAVASVNASTGVVTAKAQGQTTITASDAANQSASYNVTVTAAFAIDTSTVTLAPGGTATRTATGGTTPYSYVSANAAVATVNASTGAVAAKAQGQTTITATDAANQSASYNVTVTSAFAIDTSIMTLAPGGTSTRTATGGTTPYSYVSANAAVASVNASTGVVTAKTQGQTTITASDVANQSASYNVTVTAALAIDSSLLTLAPGGTATRTATGGTTPYSYAATNAAVATVDASTGRVTAKAQGQTRITAKDAANQSASYIVSVTTAFAIDTSTVTLALGGTSTRTATGGITPYSYAAANAAVATVDASTGRVTAKAQGQTKITASDAANHSASYNVTVTSAFAIDTSTVTLAPGGTATRTATGGTTPYTYVSANAAVATVNASTGAVAAKVQGQTKITATDAANQSASYNVTVTAAFAIHPSTVTLAPGSSETRTATGGTPPYRYVSADVAVATVNASTGAVAAKAQGQTTITASDAANQSASYNVTVTAAFAIETSPVTLAPGGTSTRTATGGKTPYSYVSLDVDVAIVNAATGAVTALAEGTTRIFASDSAGNSAYYYVSVAPVVRIETFDHVAIGPIGSGIDTPLLHISSNVGSGDIAEVVIPDVETPPYFTGRGLLVNTQKFYPGEAPLTLTPKPACSEITVSARSLVASPCKLQAFSSSSGVLLDEAMVSSSAPTRLTLRGEGADRIRIIRVVSSLNPPGKVYIELDNVEMKQ